MPPEKEPLWWPFRAIGWCWTWLTRRSTLFVLAFVFCALWLKYPVYTPDEAVRIEAERLEVERQRMEYERERLAILARVVSAGASAFERALVGTNHPVTPANVQP